LNLKSGGKSNGQKGKAVFTLVVLQAGCQLFTDYFLISNDNKAQKINCLLYKCSCLASCHPSCGSLPRAHFVLFWMLCSLPYSQPTQHPSHALYGSPAWSAQLRAVMVFVSKTHASNSTFNRHLFHSSRASLVTLHSSHATGWSVRASRHFQPPLRLHSHGLREQKTALLRCTSSVQFFAFGSRLFFLTLIEM